MVIDMRKFPSFIKWLTITLIALLISVFISIEIDKIHLFNDRTSSIIFKVIFFVIYAILLFFWVRNDRNWWR